MEGTLCPPFFWKRIPVHVTVLTATASGILVCVLHCFRTETSQNQTPCATCADTAVSRSMRGAGVFGSQTGARYVHACCEQRRTFFISNRLRFSSPVENPVAHLKHACLLKSFRSRRCKESGVDQRCFSLRGVRNYARARGRVQCCCCVYYCSLEDDTAVDGLLSVSRSRQSSLVPQQQLVGT